MTEQSLSDYAKQNRKFIKIEDGQSVRATFKGFRIMPNSFDTDKDTVVYKLQLPDMELGKTVTWQNGSTKVADQMAKIKEGDEIVISRTGSTAKDTHYNVKLVGANDELVTLAQARKTVSKDDSEVPF